jgi:hypothetical protein
MGEVKKEKDCEREMRGGWKDLEKRWIVRRRGMADGRSEEREGLGKGDAWWMGRLKKRDGL